MLSRTANIPPFCTLFSVVFIVIFISEAVAVALALLGIRTSDTDSTTFF